ncbi:MAG: poly-gamma-glutamate synthase PgsB [Candidatus Cloacimonas sp. 4484_275]|nr:MAG: poly-gamma-glutamate synthase PgsB [Candidatus Cloacimonas sp. 4484_275]RLC49791.1 MAG: poly-gamma-glutamate synthase PgsB [Candidatus Cloacimonadota bacterium]
MYSLIIGLAILIVFWIIEYHRHQYYRRQIPIIIHVNGTRGKSSVTRLIAAGLRAGGKKTLAKTTGSAPRFIFEDGHEIPVVRHFGANIKEQLKIIKFVAKRKIDILVLECMAVNPEYQWITEHQMVKADVGVITNSRPDHLDLMGPGLRNVTLSLCNTIPKNGIMFTAERKVFPLMKKQADKLHAKLIQSDDSVVTDEDMRGFSYFEHKENVALSLKVCEHFGVDKKTALSGMYKATPDVGATEVMKVIHNNKELLFAHSFAANDPESTEFLIKNILNSYGNIESVIFILSTRADRMFRSKQLIEMLTKFDFKALFLIGDQEQTIKTYALKFQIPEEKIYALGWISGENLVERISKIIKKEALLFGIGNIHGNGEKIVDYFKERKV